MADDRRITVFKPEARPVSITGARLEIDELVVRRLQVEELEAPGATGRT